MRTQSTLSIACENDPNPTIRALARRRTRRSLMLVCIVLVVIIISIITPWVSLRAASPAAETVAFHELILTDQGDVAVQILAEIAQARGGWGPAPGDMVVYDRAMLHMKRASTIAIDLSPTNCGTGDPKEPQNPDCGRDFQVQQNQVRFGRYTFDNATQSDTFEPRSLDDMLSVYIEEVGHSWQEYCYETEGRCTGERTIQTTYREGKRLTTGWEYQVKMYILSLDGTWLNLSDKERDELTSAICDGYANPSYRPVSEYPAPPYWPNPTGWPIVAPTADDLHVFCAE